MQRTYMYYYYYYYYYFIIKMLACKHCLSFACKRSSKVHPASQRALVGQMRLLFSWKSIWKPCSLSVVTPNVHHACLYRVQQVLPRHVSSADSQLWWSQTKHIVTLPITRLLYCNCCHITYLQHLFHHWQSGSLTALRPVYVKKTSPK